MLNKFYKTEFTIDKENMQERIDPMDRKSKDIIALMNNKKEGENK